MLRAVIFDLDGTLYDNRRLHWYLPVVEFFALHLGYLWRERRARRTLRGVWCGAEPVGQGPDEASGFFARLFPLVSARHPERAARWYRGHYLPLQVRILRRCCHVDAWVVPCLAALRQQGIRVALYSDYDFADAKLRALGLDPALFDLVVDAPSLGGLKPCAESAREVLRRLGVAADEAVFVGDREECDVATARNVGAHALLVSRRGGRAECSPEMILNAYVAQ